GLCRLDVPVSLGGHEAEPVVALQVFEELAWADASVAWIAWNNHFVCLASRYVSDAVRTALFRDARGLFAHATRPSGQAVVVDDVFVPAERTLCFTDSPQRDRPLARMPMAPTMCAGCAALCLGLAQAATDTLLELGASKVQVGPFPGLRERPDVQGMVASTA